jgi:hypothetical protein
VNTNILLIVIIVLLALGLLVQLLQLIVIFSFPAQILNLFQDFLEALLESNETTGADIIDVVIREPSQPTSSKGFGKSEKSKGSKRKWVGKTNQTSTDASPAKNVQSHLSSQKSVKEDLSSPELTNTEIAPGINLRDSDKSDSLVDNSSSDLEAKQELVKSEPSEPEWEEEIPSAVVQLFEQSKSGKVRQRELLEAIGLSKQELKNNPPQWWRKLKKRGIGWYEL